MIENPSPPAPVSTDREFDFLYSVVRYTPDLLRDEWVNIGVLLFDPRTGDRHFRLIEDEEEFHRVRPLHPQADERLLRSMQAHLESRFDDATASGVESGEWEKVLRKWEATLSNALQLAPLKSSLGQDLDTELQRLYADPYPAARAEQAYRGAARACGLTARKCSTRLACGRSWKNLCA